MAKLWTSGGKLVQCGNGKLGYDDNCQSLCTCSCFRGQYPIQWPCGGLLQTYNITRRKWIVLDGDPNEYVLYDISIPVSFVGGQGVCRWQTVTYYYGPSFYGCGSWGIDRNTGMFYDLVGFEWRDSLNGWYDNNNLYGTNKRDPRVFYEISYTSPGCYYATVFVRNRIS